MEIDFLDPLVRLFTEYGMFWAVVVPFITGLIISFVWGSAPGKGKFGLGCAVVLVFLLSFLVTTNWWDYDPGFAAAFAVGAMVAGILIPAFWIALIGGIKGATVVIPVLVAGVVLALIFIEGSDNLQYLVMNAIGYAIVAVILVAFVVSMRAGKKKGGGGGAKAAAPAHH